VLSVQGLSSNHCKIFALCEAVFYFLQLITILQSVPKALENLKYHAGVSLSDIFALFSVQVQHAVPGVLQGLEDPLERGPGLELCIWCGIGLSGPLRLTWAFNRAHEALDEVYGFLFAQIVSLAVHLADQMQQDKVDLAGVGPRIGPDYCKYAQVWALLLMFPLQEVNSSTSLQFSSRFAFSASS
jgi:hypothetical protein